MRRLANLYIILFLAGAIVSLLDELLVVAGTLFPPLSAANHVLSNLVIVYSLVVFVCLGVDRRLSKWLLLPLIFYVSWRALAMWPLSAVVDRQAIGLVAASGQALLGGLVILLRGLSGQVLLSAEQLRGPVFSWRNTLGFTAANILLLPLVLVFSGLAIADRYIGEHTAGFLRISPVGVYLVERSYHRDQKTIRLAGMMHIGKEDYYRDLIGSMAQGGTIILTEGVTDRDHLLKNPFNYSKLARVIGLTSQQTMSFDGRLVDLDNLDKMRPQTDLTGRPDIAPADIDLNRFDPDTIEFLNVLGNTLFSGKPLEEALAEYNAWVQANMTGKRVAKVMADILDKRNAVVIDRMLRSLRFYDTIIIPWGAMHMPAIENAVISQGFRFGMEKERLGLDFRTIPYADLWQKWSSARSSAG